MSIQFNERATLRAIASCAYESECLRDILVNAFKLNPWIIGKWKAKKALEQFDDEDKIYKKTDLNGIQGAIQYVQDYEKDRQYENLTRSSDLEALASMVAYINGAQIINRLAEKFHLFPDDQYTEQQRGRFSNVDTLMELLD